MTTGDTRPRLPRYRRADTPPPMRLTERDQDILSLAEEYRFITREQVQALLFTPAAASAAKRRLTLLFHNGYLGRQLLPLRSAFGANRAVYFVDRRGAAVLELLEKTGVAVPTWRTRQNFREELFLRHLVATNDVRVAVSLAAQREELGLTWTDERALRRMAMRTRIIDPKAPGTRLAVVPDGYFALTLEKGTQGFALELDRCTVEERKFRTKIRALGEWFATGTHRSQFGESVLRVLFVIEPSARDPSRVARTKRWTELESGRGLFWFTTLPELTDVSVLHDPIWHVAGREGRFPLLAR